jgi:hypothetical protein
MVFKKKEFFHKFPIQERRFPANPLPSKARAGSSPTASKPVLIQV